MNEYSALTLDGVCDLLASPQATLIIFHDRPDGDAAGSAFALRLLLEAMGSRARCVCSSEIGHRCEFAVAGLQDSVLPCSIPDDFNAERIITVDTAAPTQMQALGTAYHVDLMIDHHAAGTPYADNLICPRAAACGEIIFDIAKRLVSRGMIERLPERFSGLVYMAIATDTGCFKYSNTTPDTHRRIAELMDGSFDYAEWNFRLFDSKPRESLTLSHAAIENIHFFFDNRLAIVAMDYPTLSALNVSHDCYDGLIDTARAIDGVEIAISVRQTSDTPDFRVSARSNGSADVAALCSRFGGGGHTKAAGCTVHADSLDAAMKLLIEAAEEQLK